MGTDEDTEKFVSVGTHLDTGYLAAIFKFNLIAPRC